MDRQISFPVCVAITGMLYMRQNGGNYFHDISAALVDLLNENMCMISILE